MDRRDFFRSDSKLTKMKLRCQVNHMKKRVPAKQQSQTWIKRDQIAAQEKRLTCNHLQQENWKKIRLQKIFGTIYRQKYWNWSCNFKLKSKNSFISFLESLKLAAFQKKFLADNKFQDLFKLLKHCIYFCLKRQYNGWNFLRQKGC